MVIAGLDVATKSGLAIFDDDKLLHAEAFRPKGKTNGEINSGFRSWLVSTFASHAVERVAAEEPLVTNLTDKDGKPLVTGQTYRRLYGLAGILEEVCFTKNYPLVFVHQGTWRRAFLGTGRGDKEMAVAKCKMLGYDFKSKDLCEAIGVAYWLRGHLQERTLFDKINESAA